MLHPCCSGVKPVNVERVFVTPASVSPSIAERQGMKRGWFTYTDLCVLLEQSAWSQALTAFYQHFTKVRRRFEFSGADFYMLEKFQVLFGVRRPG